MRWALTSKHDLSKRERVLVSKNSCEKACRSGAHRGPHRERGLLSHRELLHPGKLNGWRTSRARSRLARTTEQGRSEGGRVRLAREAGVADLLQREHDGVVRGIGESAHRQLPVDVGDDGWRERKGQAVSIASEKGAQDGEPSRFSRAISSGRSWSVLTALLRRGSHQSCDER